MVFSQSSPSRTGFVAGLALLGVLAYPQVSVADDTTKTPDKVIRLAQAGDAVQRLSTKIGEREGFTGAKSAVRSVNQTTPKSVGPAVRAKARSGVAQHDYYMARISKIRNHHRVTPFKMTSRDFAAKPKSRALDPTVRKRAPGARGINILRKVAVTKSAGISTDYASPISEPSVATRNKAVLVTGNWYAANSSNGGKSFKVLNPWAVFGKGSVGGEFCCDQLALYDKKHDLMLWFLQGGFDDTGNTVKLCLAKGQKNIRSANYACYEFTSPSILNQKGLWLDFPDMAVTDKHLFITSNVFQTTGEQSFTGSVVMRMPLAPLAKGASFNYDIWTSTSWGSLRLTSGAKSRMYWGTNPNNEVVVMYYWDDSTKSVVGPIGVQTTAWQYPTAETVASSAAPNGKPWLLRRDARITAGWVSGDTIGFGWTAGADEAHPYPYIRVVLAHASTLKPENVDNIYYAWAEPSLYSTAAAFAYPAASPNSEGKVGLAFAYGGPKNYPSFALGVLNETGLRAYEWDVGSAIAGKNTPTCPKEPNCGVWGDYFNVRVHGAKPDTWVTAGFTLQNTGKQPLNAQSEYIWFSHSDPSRSDVAKTKK